MGRKIINGVITRTYLGEYHGCLSSLIYISCDGFEICFGGYCLGFWDDDIGAPCTGTITEIMKTLEKCKWEDLPGTYVRVDVDKSKLGTLEEPIYAIGHIMKNKWFSYDDYFKKHGK